MSNLISEVKVYKANKQGTSFLGNGSFVVGGAVKVNFSLIQGSKGPFVALPQTSYQKDGKTEYKKEVQFIEREFSDEVNREVLAIYESGGTPRGEGTGTNTSASTTKGAKTAPRGGLQDDLPF